MSEMVCDVCGEAIADGESPTAHMAQHVDLSELFEGLTWRDLCPSCDGWGRH